MKINWGKSCNPNLSKYDVTAIVIKHRFPRGIKVNIKSRISFIWLFFLLMFECILFKAAILWTNIYVHNTQNNILSSSHKNIIIFHLKISFESFFLAKFLKTIVFQSCHYPIQCIYFLSLPRSYLNVKDIQFSLENDELIIL